LTRVVALLVVLSCFAAGAGAEIAKRQATGELWGIAPKGAVAPTPAGLQTLHGSGINALVVDLQRLGEPKTAVARLEALRGAARSAGMSLVVLVPEQRHDAPTLAACGLSSVRCASLAGSLPVAKSLAKSTDRTRPLVAVRVSKPSLLDQLASLQSVRRPILVIAPLYKTFNSSLWDHVLATTVASPAVELAIAPVTGIGSASVQTFGAALVAASSSNGDAQRVPKPCASKPHGRCTDVTPPTAPAVALVGVTASAATVSWLPSVDDVGVAAYRTYVGNAMLDSAATSPETVGGLTCGVPVSIAVAAVDAAGNVSSPSSVTATPGPCAASAPPPADTEPPSTPGGVSTAGVGPTTVTLSWNASVDDVGVSGYRLFRDGSQVGTASSRSYSFGGLTCGTAYTLGVAAVDAAGNVSGTATTTVATAACPDTTAPSTPGGLATSAVGETSATLSWSPSSDDVGVSGYRLFRGGLQVGTSPGTSYAFGGLSCGTAYTLGVAAVDDAGNVSGTATTAVTTAACSDTSAPSVPTGLATSAVTQAAATLSWKAASDNVGVTGYRLFRGGLQVGSSSSTSYDFGGLTCGTAYTLGVAAVDEAGNVSGTATTAVTTAACPDTTAPSTPAGLATSAVGQTSASLSWNAASDNVGVTGYRLFRGGSQVGTSSGTSYAFGSLTCGTAYTLGVAAIDAAGNVSATATTAVTTAACSDTSAPSVPTALATSAATQTAVTLSWSASIDNVGVTGYSMFKNGTQVATWLAPGYIFSGLSCGTTYTLGVAAVDAAGNVSATASTTATTAACTDNVAPSIPSGLTLTGAGQTSATLSWSSSTDNVGVAGYRFFVNGSQVGTTAATSYGASGLTCGQTYTFGVAAFDAAGNASAAAAISAATAACGGGGGAANLFVASSGSDTTCSRAASPISFGSAAGHVCASFDKACHLASGGDTVIVEDGRYAGQDLSDCTGLSSTVTFRTEPGHECPYSAATPYDQLPAQSSDTSCKVKIDGELNMSAAKTGSPVDSPLKNLTFVGMYAGDLKTTWAHNITFSHMATEFFIILGSDAVTVQDSDIGNSFDGTCSITAMAETAAGGSVAQPTNIKILRNIFHDEIRTSSSQSHPDGLFIYEMDGGVIDGNVMYRAGVIGIYMNLVEWSPLYGLGKINNVQITNNVIHDIVDMTNTDGPTHSVAQNTLAPQNISLGDNDISNVTVAFNSVSGWIRRQDQTSAGGGGAGSTSNLKIYGNVASGVVYGNGFGCPAGATVDYNFLYDANAVKCGAHDVKGSNPFTAPDAWSTAGSYFTVTPGNFSTRSDSPARNLVPSSFCSANACPATDFNGVARPQGAGYDAGAYENG
jgi:chitodextrinase